MDIFGCEIDIYLIIVVIAIILVLGIILAISKSMRTKKNISKPKKEMKRNVKLKESSQDEFKIKPQVKSQQHPQDTVPEEAKKEAIVKPPADLLNNPSLETKNSPETEKGTPDGTDTEKSAPRLSPLWKTETTQKVEESNLAEEPEVIENNDDIADIFNDIYEAEDSNLSELAESLTDVNIDTLIKLGEELSQVLSKSDSGIKRRHDYE